MASFLALALALAVLLLGSSDAACAPNGVDIGGLCSCFSGFTGSDCSVSDDTCLPLGSVLNLSTEPVAELMGNQSSLAASTFTFVLESPATQDRYFSAITLNSSPNCTFPGPHFTKTFLGSPTCRDVFTGSFSVPELKDVCGFLKTTQPGSEVLSGTLSVVAVDALGDFRGHQIQRTTTSHLEVELTLPTFVNLTVSDLTVLSPITLMAAVTFQEYDVGSDTATIKLTTSVQFPYTLSSPVFTLGPSFPTLPPMVFFEDVSCSAGQPGEDCLQETTIVITDLALLGKCSFDGAYSISWAYECLPGLQGCPITGAETIQTLFNLTSGDICGKVEVVASIDGDIETYSDAALTQEGKVFVANQRVYFKVILTSDVSVQAIALNDLSLTFGRGAPLTLVAERSALPPYDERILYNASYSAQRPQELVFSFITSYGEEAGDIFQSTDPTGVFPFTLELSLEVAYRTTFGRKRDLSSTNLSLTTRGVVVPA